MAGPARLWRERFGVFVERARARLGEEPEVLDWLAARGIDAAAADRARLGWNPGDGRGRDLYRERAAWGVPEARHEDGRRKRLWLPVGLVIPCFSSGGELQRVRIRRPRAERGPRYYVVPGGTGETLTVDADRPLLVVVEAELDAITVAARTPAGAIGLGSAQAKPTPAARAHLARARQILIALDADDAGARAAAWWLERYPRAERWPVPVGKDPGEAFARGLDLAAWVEAALAPALRQRPAAAVKRAETSEKLKDKAGKRAEMSEKVGNNPVIGADMSPDEPESELMGWEEI
jgi:hypothetical protein